MTKLTRNEPRSYVVRVYRRTARWFAGYVEDVRSGQMRPFRSAHELWSAIGGPARPAARNHPASRKESQK
ncbi:MAG TPA: hypothetical protein VJQ52_03345 [Steroidobacteraceae bacterium]|nr:hypothetical protein [Steroidobacteraceae bacterium]